MSDKIHFTPPQNLPFADWFALQQLHAAYALAVDGMDFELLGSLFTEDAVIDLDARAPDLPAKGRTAIVGALRSRREGAALAGGRLRRHVISNLLVQAASGDRIDACVVMQLVETRADGVHILQTSMYTDVFRRTDGTSGVAGRWLFASRALKRDLAPKKS